MSKISRQVPAYHAHGCVECGRRYRDVCDTPFVNGRCHTCATGHPAPVWERAHWPRECCRDHSKLITDVDTLNRFRLGGSGSWWRCLKCHRTHPFDPQGVVL